MSESTPVKSELNGGRATHAMERADEAMSLEDVLASAMWVSSLTDASLSAERLHEAFMRVIFSCISNGSDDEHDHSNGATGAAPRLRTAAELERERRRKEELLREIRELEAQPMSDETTSQKDEEDDEEDDEEEEEAFRLQEQDLEFLEWIDTTQRPQTTRSTTTTATAAAGDEESVAPFARSSYQDGAIELELNQVGLGESAEEAATDVLPERFREIELRERRPRLRAKVLAGGYTYTLPVENEAYWILRQLRSPGQPLEHNTRICALANRTQREIADEPVLVAIAFAVEKMVREMVEPAVLMLHHQTPLHPLLCALLEGSEVLTGAEEVWPWSSCAYSIRTGRRQRPYLSDHYVGFAPLASRPMPSDSHASPTVSVTGSSSRGSGEADSTSNRLWDQVKPSTDVTQRKPGFIELGRLLLRILELDALCHRLECRRQQLLLMLQDSADARVQDQRTLLEHIVFESTAEADVWHSFVQSLMGVRSKDAYYRVRELGLEDTFEEYSITGMQYQENLLANAPINLCPSPRMSLYAWAEQVGRGLARPRGAEFVLALFNHAIVSQFSKLPVLCKQIIHLFCTEGNLIVTHKWLRRSDDVYSLASFFDNNARHYFHLLQMERQGSVGLYYVLDTDLVRRVLNVHKLYQQPTRTSYDGLRNSEGNATHDDDDDNDVGSEWNRERGAAMEVLALRLTESVIPKVKTELYQQALYQTQMSCVQRLAMLCEQGPYEPTHVCVEGYDRAAETWETSWNVVEALPGLSMRAHPATYDSRSGRAMDVNPSTAPWSRARLLGPRRCHRVCAAYRAEHDTSAVYFTCIDEYGVITGQTRWVECAMTTLAGRATALRQSSALARLLIQCAPTVVVLGASDVAAMSVLQRVQDVMEQRVTPETRVRVPIVWANCDVARYYSVTRYAEEAASRSSHALHYGGGGVGLSAMQGMSSEEEGRRISVALARYAQEPLQVLCALFDTRRTIVQLCTAGCGVEMSSGGGGGGVGSLSFGGLGGEGLSAVEQEELLFRRLRWEMSLWVTGCGFWAEDAIHRPHSEAWLSFIAGLGPCKSRVLHRTLSDTPPRSRRELYSQLRRLFGDYVADNAVHFIRLAAPPASVSASAGDVWHPLDQTLIPWTWYPAAASLAACAVLRMLPNATPSPSALRAMARVPSVALLILMHGGNLTPWRIPVAAAADGHEPRPPARHDTASAAAAQDEVVLLGEDDPLPDADELLDMYHRKGSTRTRRGRQTDATDAGDAEREEDDAAVPFAALPVTLYGEREVEFILDEVRAAGYSALRRPYRRLTHREWMMAMTGVMYISQHEAVQLQNGDANGSGGVLFGSDGSATAGGGGMGAGVRLSVVREGDYVGGTVTGVRGGSRPGIRLVTSTGLRAVMAAVDVSDEGMRVELLEHIRRTEDVMQATHNDATAHATDEEGSAPTETNRPATDSDASRRAAMRLITPPEWLRRGAPLQGRVLRCNWRRCELLLRWCAPVTTLPALPTAAKSSAASEAAAAAAAPLPGVPSYATLVKPTASSVNSLKTVQMDRDVRVFATKVSRHPLFRDVGSARALELLQDKEVGEVLLRPARQFRHKAVCMVKVGLNCISNWIISEERHPDGSIFYRLKDRVVDEVREFGEVDEFLRNYIAPMVQHVQNIRQHRRFQETMRDVSSALAAQERSGYGFAYAFVESGQSCRPPHYRVVTRGGGREHRFRLHLTDRAVYVRLPFAPVVSSTADGAEEEADRVAGLAEFKWVECRNAEHVSETIKKHAALTAGG